MRYSILYAAAALATMASAQTYTSCNPLDKTCPADPALGKTVTVDFTKGASDQFTLAEGTNLTYESDGAHFTITEDGQAPTITSNWYIFFGHVDIVMKAAPGVGIVSSFVMESDDLDEIDLEWLGGDTTQVETNYFGKGNTTTYDRATYVPVATPQNTFHTYSVDWKSSAITWSVDGTVVRTLNYADANGGSNFPQTPMQVKMGNWVGGGKNSPPGTVQWAGGYTDFSQAPFTMIVKSVTIQDYSTGGSSYVYSDNSGSWQSIKISDQAVNNTSSSASASGSTSATSGTTSSVAASTTAGNLGAGAVVSSTATAATTLATSTKSSSSSSKTSASASTSATSSTNAAGQNGASYFAAAVGALAYFIL